METSKSSFRDLAVWQQAIEFANLVIDLSEHLQSDRKHYRLLEQLEAAATSVAMNIAEGKGRYSKKEFIQFLYIARGSLYETMTLLTIFQKRGWVAEAPYNTLDAKAISIARMLNALIASVRE